MTGVHVQVSTAWLADRIRATASRIRARSSPSYYNAITEELDVLAKDLEGVTTFPPPSPAGAPSPLSPPDPADWARTELRAALLDVRGALERQPHEPTVNDLLEVLIHVLQHGGGAPTRSVPADPSWTAVDPLRCTDLCPLKGTSHEHRDGRLFWS